MDVDLFYRYVGLIILKIKSVDKSFLHKANYDNLLKNARNAKNTVAALQRLSVAYPIIKEMYEFNAILGADFVLSPKEYAKYSSLVIANSLQHGGYRINAGRKKTLPDGAKAQTLIITPDERKEINKLISKMRGIDTED